MSLRGDFHASGRAERLIEFPVPEWVDIFNEVKDCGLNPICLCYQYDFDEKGFGPYGFITENAEKLLSTYFDGLSLFDSEKLEFKEKRGIGNSGLYFWGENENNKAVMDSLLKYRLWKRKNEFLSKKGGVTSSTAPSSILLNSFRKHAISAIAIDQMVKGECDFFISHLFAPEAGQSIVMFGEKTISKFIKFAQSINIQTVKMNSYDNLKSW